MRTTGADHGDGGCQDGISGQRPGVYGRGGRVAAQSIGARPAFTLIELLVVIAIVATLVGILLPALANARKTAKAVKCASNLRGNGLAFQLYSNEFKGWYPVIPFNAAAATQWRTNGFMTHQGIYGGVAGLYSLYQNPDGGEAPAIGDFGFVGSTGSYDRANPPGYIRTTGLPAITAPLMRNFTDSVAALTCPLHQQDTYFNRDNSTRRMGSDDPNTYPDLQSANTVLKQPKAVGNEFGLVRYNVSYLYIAGFKADEAVVIKPAPMFGDETRGLDLKGRAWYGDARDRPFPEIQVGYQHTWDAHGTAGAQFVFTDNHVELVKYDIQRTFFSDANNSPQSVNVIDKTRSNRLQTID